MPLEVEELSMEGLKELEAASPRKDRGPRAPLHRSV